MSADHTLAPRQFRRMVSANQRFAAQDAFLKGAAADKGLEGDEAQSQIETWEDQADQLRNPNA